MSPVSFTLILQSHTHRVAALIRRTLAFVLLLGLLPLIWPVPFIALAGTMMVREILRAVQTVRCAAREAAALTHTLHGTFPGSPAIRPGQLRRLVRREKLALNGDGGARLLLSISEPVRLRRLRHGYTLRAVFHPGDYGLEEFDSIMRSLGHNPPVAAAVGAVDGDEWNSGKLPTAAQLPQPPKPLAQVREPAAPISTFWNDSSRGIADAFREGYHSNSLKKPLP